MQKKKKMYFGRKNEKNQGCMKNDEIKKKRIMYY